ARHHDLRRDGVAGAAHDRLGPALAVRRLTGRTPAWRSGSALPINTAVPRQAGVPMLPDIRDYEALVAGFRWHIPARYNIGVDCCDRWAAAEPGRPAIIEVSRDGRVETLTYDGLRRCSNRLANALARRGVAAGDRVAILLPQSRQVAIAHMAIYKLGAIALPLAVLFGV